VNEAHDREAIALIESSALATRLARWFDCVELAWKQSATRRLARGIGATLADRRGAALAVATAAVVALLMQRLAPVREPGAWMVPAAAVVWSAVTLLRTTRSQ
jgi:hypothetical protein